MNNSDAAKERYAMAAEIPTGDLELLMILARSVPFSAPLGGLHYRPENRGRRRFNPRHVLTGGTTTKTAQVDHLRNCLFHGVRRDY